MNQTAKHPQSVQDTLLRGRLGTGSLRELALETIEEAAAAAHMGPVRRSRGIALALAWLRHRGSEKVLPLWPFNGFWEGLGSERQHDRWSAVNAAANAIYLALDVPRRPAVISAFECQLRHTSGGSEAAGPTKGKAGMPDRDLNHSGET